MIVLGSLLGLVSLAQSPWGTDIFLHVFLKKYLFIYVYLASPGLSWSMWGLVSQPGIEPRFPALNPGSLHVFTHTTILSHLPGSTEEVPGTK